MNEFLLKCLDLLDLFSDLASRLFDWLLTEVDFGILGTIQPIALLSYGLIVGWIITRIVLSINS